MIGGISLKSFTRGICVFFTAALLFILFLPAPASAADNASVLKTIGHENTDTVSLYAQRDVTLYVPNNYAEDTVDLQNGLVITYDENTYKNVIAVPESQAEVDKSAVTVTVTYNEIEDADSDEKSQTEYQVNVKRTAARDPDF